MTGKRILKQVLQYDFEDYTDFGNKRKPHSNVRRKWSRKVVSFSTKFP